VTQSESSAETYQSSAKAMVLIRRKITPSGSHSSAPQLARRASRHSPIWTLVTIKLLASKGLMVLVIGAVTMAICSCKGGERARMVQFCVNSEADMASLGGMIQETAPSSGMRFRDNGPAHDRGTKTIGVHPGYSVFSYSAIRPDGLWLSASNLGLSSREAAVGFVPGADLEESEAIFDGFVKLLSTKWRVRDVPEERGALRSLECEDR